MPAAGNTRRKSAAKDSASGVRERFIEQMGIIAQGDGVPRIAGRMMGLMIFDGRPYSFSELATELQVSRGSVSTNARILEQMGILERTAVPGERQDYFQLADSPYEAVLSGALARSRKARQVIANTADALPAKGQSGPKRRLQEFGAFYATIIEALESATSNRD